MSNELEEKICNIFEDWADDLKDNTPLFYYTTCYENLYKYYLISQDDSNVFSLTNHIRIECHKNISFDLSILNRKNILIELWDSCLSKSSEDNKEAWFIFSNNSGIYIITTESFMTGLIFYYGRFRNYYLEFNDYLFDCSRYWIIKLSDFLEYIDLDGIQNMYS